MPGSDPATKPRARAVIHKARWVSEAECRFRGSATGLRGANCVLHPPNIFPEWPDEASDQGGTSVSLRAPYFSPCQNLTLPRDTCTDPQRKKKKRDTTTQNVGCGVKKKSLLLFSNESGNP